MPNLIADDPLVLRHRETGVKAHFALLNSSSRLGHVERLFFAATDLVLPEVSAGLAVTSASMSAASFASRSASAGRCSRQQLARKLHAPLSPLHLPLWPFAASGTSLRTWPEPLPSYSPLAS